jgi:hypothetical protein
LFVLEKKKKRYLAKAMTSETKYIENKKSLNQDIIKNSLFIFVNDLQDYQKQETNILTYSTIFKQIFLMLILLFVYALGLDGYQIFIIAFFFYSLDSINNLVRYLLSRFESLYLLNNLNDITK